MVGEDRTGTATEDRAARLDFCHRFPAVEVPGGCGIVGTVPDLTVATGRRFHGRG